MDELLKSSNTASRERLRDETEVRRDRMVTPDKPARLDSASSNAAGRAFDHREVARKLKTDYAHGSKDPSIRALDSVNMLAKYLMKNDPDIDEMLEQAARLIFTQFNIKEVSIGLRTPSDGLFRYVAMHGMRAEVWAAHKKLAYTYDQLLDPKKYKHTVISHFTRLFLAEDNPYTQDETYTYSEHLMSISKRRAPDDSIEGDYLDVYMYGPGDEVLGWVETGGTWDGKIPDARTIRSLEMLATIIGIGIIRHQWMTGQRSNDQTQAKV